MACTKGDFGGMVGHAFVVDLEPWTETRFDFQGVEYGADCGISNAIDIDEDLVMLEMEAGVALYDLAGNPIQTFSFEVVQGRWPRLDGGTVYFLDYHAETIRRINVATGGRDALLSGVPGVLNGSLHSFQAETGFVGWTRVTEGGHLLSVYDVANGAFVLQDLKVGESTMHAARLIALNRTRASVLVNFSVVLAVDLQTGQMNETLAIPQVTFEVDQFDSRIVYSVYGAAGNLTLYDSANGSTRLLQGGFTGRNLDLYGDILAYDTYEDLPFAFPTLLPLAAGGAVLVAAAAVVLLHLRKRP